MCVLVGIPSMTFDLTSRAGRLNAIAQAIKAKTYLEIGAYNDETFRQVNIESKVAVDPNFIFDYKPLINDKTMFFECESDKFFACYSSGFRTFDLIYIDGLHTFEQTFRDLLNSLSFCHRCSVILIDDTMPINPAAAEKYHRDWSILSQTLGIIDRSWMGDVYKLIAAVHDYLPQYSFHTFPGHGQAVLTYQPRDLSSTGKVLPRFKSLEDISRITFTDFLKLCGDDFFNIAPTNQACIDWIDENYRALSIAMI